MRFIFLFLPLSTSIPFGLTCFNISVPAQFIVNNYTLLNWTTFQHPLAQAALLTLFKPSCGIACLPNSALVAIRLSSSDSQVKLHASPLGFWNHHHSFTSIPVIVYYLSNVSMYIPPIIRPTDKELDPAAADVLLPVLLWISMNQSILASSQAQRLFNLLSPLTSQWEMSPHIPRMARANRFPGDHLSAPGTPWFLSFLFSDFFP